jgi:hypothetical protein
MVVSNHFHSQISKAKLQQDMHKLRSFYDNKLSNVEGQIADLPPTAAGNSFTKYRRDWVKTNNYYLFFWQYFH